MIDALPTRIDKLMVENTQLHEKVKLLTDELADVKEQLGWFKRQVFGAKSERFVPTNEQQYSLDLGIKKNEPAPAVLETVTYNRKRPDANKTPHSREEIPAHLPRTIVDVTPDFDTTNMEKIGEKITEQLEYTPPAFKVTRYVVPVFAKKTNEQRIIQAATLPPLCIDKGKAGPSLVAHTIISKCVDHIPHYRLASMINRECDMRLPESTIRDWYRQGIFWLEAIAQRCREIALQSNYLQMDESGIKVMIHPTHGKSHKGAMIVQHAPLEKIVLFNYQQNKTTETIIKLLGDFKGILQSDGLKQYIGVCSRNDTLLHAGCMDHCRRGFEKALTNDNKRATHVLTELKALYAIEEEARCAALDHERRLALRKEKSVPVIAALFDWMKEQLASVRPHSSIGKAILYALGREEELRLFCKHGHIEISNILIENAIRPLAVGRNNFLFCGSEDGARRLAVAYTVMGTCKINGVNQSHYLPYVLSELPKRKSNDIDDLLPMNWKDPHSK